MLRRAFLSFAASLGALPLISKIAAAAPQPANKWGLVFGSKGFPGENIGGDNTARAAARALKQQYGFANSRVKLVLEPSFMDFLDGLAWLRANTNSGSSVFIVHSGHGNIDISGIHWATWASELSTIEFDRLAMVFESCYSKSLIPGLSGERRVIVASAEELGATRSGHSSFEELFVNDGMLNGLPVEACCRSVVAATGEVYWSDGYPSTANNSADLNP